MAALSRVVIALGIVSLLTDFSSEMIYPLLPLFLTQVLGVGALALGVIEGVAESTAATLKIVSGFWTDRTSRRKPFIFAGYALAGLARPLISLATTWPFVLAMRFFDRIGKGLRTSPRDALIADVTHESMRGKAYGFHRAMDHAGAVVGPLIAALLLTIEGVTLRHVFMLAAIPAIAVILVILAGVKEPRPQDGAVRSVGSLGSHWQDLGRDFKLVLLALLVFTLGNSSDTFILLRLSDSGFPAAWVSVLWSAHHVIKMMTTYYGGILSDRMSRRRLIIIGWLVYAIIYLAFALVHSQLGLLVVFIAYGVYFGLTEPTEKAWIVDLVPKHLRGTAFGYYHGVIGLASLPASLIFGFLWERWGARIPFFSGAGFAGVAGGILLIIQKGTTETKDGIQARNPKHEARNKFE